MANKPSVTLTLAGDERKLTDAFDRVGQASKSMSDTVDSSSKDMVDSGKRFEELAEKSDTVDTRAMGFRDTITGVSDTLKGLNDQSLSTEERLLTLGMGVGDFASGLTNLVIPAIGNAAAFMKGPLTSAMTFVSSHPLLITIGLLAAAFIFLIAQTDWFQQVATRVFNWVGNLAKTVFNATIGWIVDAWNGLVDWFEHLPERFGKALGNLGSIITNVFKGAVNLLVDSMNWFVDHTLNWLVDRANDVIRYLPGVPYIPHIPHIPRLHGGGVFHAEGGEGLALLRDGETVSAPGQGGVGGGPFTLTVPLLQQIQDWIDDGVLVLAGRR